MTKNWIVYILQCADNTLYTGITTDLDHRVSAHSDGTGAKYTRGRGPFKVIYTENCTDKSNASKRERQIKLLDRAAKLQLASHKE